MLCFKCFSSHDEEIGSNDSVYVKSIIQKPVYRDDDDDDDLDEEEDENENENWKLLRPSRAPSSSDYSSIFEKYRRSSETIFDVRSVRNSFDDKHDDEEALVKDTEFVVNAINESHESLRKLVSK